MGLSVQIHRDAFELGICHPTVCVIQNVRVMREESALDDDIAHLMQTINHSPEEILSRPEVQGFRELFARMGHAKITPAGERLVESFRKRGFKKYDNLIDAYNIASARFGSGIGMHDGSTLQRNLQVYRAGGTEKIIPLFKNKEATVNAGDLIYSQSERPYAWLGERDVDSDEFKLTEQTTSLLLVVLGNAATSAAYNRDAAQLVLDLIKKTCPAAEAQFLEVEFLAAKEN